jgi:hypothetical protein
MSDTVQQAIVAIFALGAAGLVVRRVWSAVRPPAGQSPCPSCDSGSTACADKAAAASSTEPEIKPLVFVRPKPHQPSRS